MLADNRKSSDHRPIWLHAVIEMLKNNYKLITDERCKAAIYMQGFCQASHGLSDTLLSILPVRLSQIGFG